MMVAKEVNPAGAHGRVVIVGAGLIGLYAATRLRAAGRQVVLVEARKRMSVRILTGQHAF